jgi:hypothetical protein
MGPGVVMSPWVCWCGSVLRGVLFGGSSRAGSGGSRVERREITVTSNLCNKASKSGTPGVSDGRWRVVRGMCILLLLMCVVFGPSVLFMCGVVGQSVSVVLSWTPGCPPGILCLLTSVGSSRW